MHKEVELFPTADGCRFHSTEELELSPVQATYEDWRAEDRRAAEERRARLARRQRGIRFRAWRRRNAGTLKFCAACAALTAIEAVGLLFLAHRLGLRVW
jgi:hypothetical protein